MLVEQNVDDGRAARILEVRVATEDDAIRAMNGARSSCTKSARSSFVQRVTPCKADLRQARADVAKLPARARASRSDERRRVGIKYASSLRDA